MSRPGQGTHAADRTARWPRLVAGIDGLLLLGLGLWAMASPAAFFDAIATFEPYNRHFLQDVGAFQIGLGAVLLLALSGRDGLAVALVGVGIGSGAPWCHTCWGPSWAAAQHWTSAPWRF